MQGCAADAILSLWTNVAILVNVTSNALSPVHYRIQSSRAA